MKKFNTILALSALLLICNMSMSQITNSAHNFTSSAWNTSGQLCKPCHTPHSGGSENSNTPLWNHQMGSNTAYTLYSSASMNAVTGQPDGSSKLCLSCHDGTVALANFGGVKTGKTFVGEATNLGASLANDHPVSFTYDAALATADGGLHNPTTALSGLGGTINNNLLTAGKMQCTSCHDVHNKAGVAKMLVKNNTGSALCLTCHNK